MAETNLYVTIVEVTDTTDKDNPKNSVIDMYSSTAEEALGKVHLANELYKSPTVKAKVVGTFKKINFIVNTEFAGEENE